MFLGNRAEHVGLGPSSRSPKLTEEQEDIVIPLDESIKKGLTLKDPRLEITKIMEGNEDLKTF